MLPENEFVEVEGRYYSNPQLPIEENNAFIDNLRNTQQATNTQIAEQTMMLGTDVPSVEGGLGSGTASSYWTSRYQTPQTAQLIQDLRTTAQAQALNEVLQNEQAMWKQRYQNAYRNYQRRAASGGGGGGPQTPSTTAGQGETEEKATDKETVVSYGGSVTASPGQTVVIGPDGIARMYIDGEYVELKEGQTYKPPLDLAPTNSLGEQSSLAPTNKLQGR